MSFQRHTGIRRHVCHICDKAFVMSTDVKSHIKAVHMNIKVVRNPRHRPAPLKMLQSRLYQPENLNDNEGQLNPSENQLNLSENQLNLSESQLDYGENQFVIDGGVAEPIIIAPSVKIKRKKLKPRYVQSVGGKRASADLDGVRIAAKRPVIVQKIPSDATYESEEETEYAIGAIERIRNIKNSLTEEYDDVAQDDLSNGIPEDYGEPSTIPRSYTGGKFPVSGKRRPQVYYEEEPSYEMSAGAGGVSRRYVVGRHSVSGKRKPGASEDVTRYAGHGARNTVRKVPGLGKRKPGGKHMPML